MKTIYCYGDSNTWGYDSRPASGERYPADVRWTGILERESGFRVINDGMNGRTIPAGGFALEALVSHLEECGAEAEAAGGGLSLWIMLGTNDILNHPDGGADYAAARMQRFLRKLRARLPVVGGSPVRVRLLAPPPLCRGAWVETDELVRQSRLLGSAFRAVAGEEQIRFTDLSGEEIPLLYDGVHFSEEGHRRVAVLLRKILYGNADEIRVSLE